MHLRAYVRQAESQQGPDVPTRRDQLLLFFQLIQVP